MQSQMLLLFCFVLQDYHHISAALNNDYKYYKYHSNHYEQWNDHFYDDIEEEIGRGIMKKIFMWSMALSEHYINDAISGSKQLTRKQFQQYSDSCLDKIPLLPDRVKDQLETLTEKYILEPSLSIYETLLVGTYNHAKYDIALKKFDLTESDFKKEGGFPYYRYKEIKQMENTNIDDSLKGKGKMKRSIVEFVFKKSINALNSKVTAGIRKNEVKAGMHWKNVVEKADIIIPYFQELGIEKAMNRMFSWLTDRLKVNGAYILDKLKEGLAYQYALEYNSDEMDIDTSKLYVEMLEKKQLMMQRLIANEEDKLKKKRKKLEERALNSKKKK